MDPSIRSAFLAAHHPELHARITARLESQLGPFPFRMAETPLFLTAELRRRLIEDATQIVDFLSQPGQRNKQVVAVPPAYHVPRVDAHPECVQVDFALTRGARGEIVPKLIELQGFPSLFALMTVVAGMWAEELDRAGMPGDWQSHLGLPSREAAVALMRRTIVGDLDPLEVALVDLTPPQQKTAPDFEATRQLVGVEPVCVTDLIVRGQRVYRRRDGQTIQVKRIYNRLVFDELERKGIIPPFRWNDELELTWCSHPNWYWMWSKYVLPTVQHPAAPRATLLSDLPSDAPLELARHVLKPLFSFAGSGVVLDVTPEAIAKIPAADRDRWVLQEKITYAPILTAPDGGPVQAEVRIMLLRPSDAPSYTPFSCITRLSRGSFLGTQHNTAHAYSGGTVGMWRA